jgi:tol-pal system protein YbgF
MTPRLLSAKPFMGSLLALALACPAVAQDKAQTLADVKAELAKLAAQLVSLKQEVVASGAATNGTAGADPLSRMDSIEAALTQLTARTEEVEQKVNAVVADGTNRIGDIEFRVCELTEGCDPGSLPPTPDLGAMAGGVAAPVASAPAAPVASEAPATSSDQPELAMNEKAEFDRAKGVLDSGDFQGAADLFKTYAQSFPGGPLVPQADLHRGDALAQIGDTPNAARAYLDAFSAKQDGPLAGQALLKLGQSLGKLGQGAEACVTLAEVGKRFPGSADASAAQAAMQAQGCQ